MSRRHADELAALILAELDAAGLGFPTDTTTDPAAAPPRLAAGALVAVVNPPRQTFTNYHEVVKEWPVWLITGPRNDRAVSWDRLDAALAALAVPLSVDEAAPEVFDDLQGATYPALTLTLTTSHDTD